MSKVILILIDGCRPDALQQADTPAIDRLIAEGAAALNARTVQPPITLPAHFSLFTSLDPADHNITANTGFPVPSAAARSLTEIVKYHGGTTAAAYSWEYLRNLSPPGALDNVFYLNMEGSGYTDLDIMDAALTMIRDQRPDLCFIYLEGTDLAGHREGWMSPPYLMAVSRADRAVGMLLRTLSEMHLEETYTVVLQSDHGGTGHHHLEPVEGVMRIPWIVRGPAVRKGHRIQSPVSILDTAPTIARLMGIPPHYAWKGRVIEELFTAFESQRPENPEAAPLQRVAAGGM